MFTSGSAASLLSFFSFVARHENRQKNVNKATRRWEIRDQFKKEREKKRKWLAFGSRNDPSTFLGIKRDSENWRIERIKGRTNFFDGPSVISRFCLFFWLASKCQLPKPDLDFFRDFIRDIGFYSESRISWIFPDLTRSFNFNGESRIGPGISFLRRNLGFDAESRFQHGISDTTEGFEFDPESRIYAESRISCGILELTRNLGFGAEFRNLLGISDLTRNLGFEAEPRIWGYFIK